MNDRIIHHGRSYVLLISKSSKSQFLSVITSENTLGKYVLLPGDFAFRGERLKRAQAPPSWGRVVDICGHLGTQDPTAIKMEME